MNRPISSEMANTFYALIFFFFNCAFASTATSASTTPPARTGNDTIFFDSNDGASAVSTRSFMTKGETIEVWVDPCVVSKVTFDEKQRNSTIVQNIVSIIKHAEGAEAACPDARVRYTQVLQYRRSTLTITAVKTDGSNAGEIVVATGPKEHLFISLDLPVNKLSALKYDSTSKTLQPSSSSPQLNWSINYQLGDVVDTADLQGLDRFSLKLMFAASSKPLNTLGVAIGYALPAFSQLDLSSVSIFGGYFWQKQDSINNGALQTDSVYGHVWRVGISFNLNDALKWVKF
jgi:hypothetical protein